MLRLPETHWLIASTTSDRVTTSHGGSFPFIAHGPGNVVVVVGGSVEVVVENVVEVLVDDEDVVVVVAIVMQSISSASTPQRLIVPSDVKRNLTAL